MDNNEGNVEAFVGFVPLCSDRTATALKNNISGQEGHG